MLAGGLHRTCLRIRQRNVSVTPSAGWYADNRNWGCCSPVDRQAHALVAYGTTNFALRRAANLHWQSLDIDKAACARSKRQAPRCLWFTGLSAAGKSTIANLVERRLHALGHYTYLVDDGLDGR